MEAILSAAREVAIDAVKQAGQLAKQYFDQEKEIVEKDEFGDLVTIVDHKAEAIILQAILSRFPDHQIRSEETGWTGDEGDWLWLVDPLDGTNNYAIGLPVYGVSVTLIYRKEPVLGVVYESHLDNLYVAEKGNGATCNGVPLSMRKGSTLRKMTAGWIQGHQVQKESGAMALKHRLDQSFKRVLRLWAPSIQWCMLARGDLDGMVLYNSEGDDLYAGLLMAREAGAVILDFQGEPFEGMSPEPYIIACHPEHAEAFVEIVRQGVAEG
ncbi:myo-inositol-1(or 4)-monophosphatase [Paenibacillus phyllosphaerae]|uniref:Myo-inositol-1(Or 4)-monophosphatase n=1 Tax=Paenibacillus phyllosphaerae TaxID=274593 RepID=A0A7W5AX44_9BACL|nr:inositol monophosphatase [Paenibacillus phyllosphaerae]MBB3110079.1 myo-inositol-1(or 4)-monophosphatase [Paenibacillus phyllosphaerae]